MKNTLFFFLIAISILSFSQKDTSIITILHINDLHAKINRFPQLKHVLDSIRKNKDDVYLFSAGDLFSGNPIVDKYEKPGWPLIDLMNDLAFDLSAIGNHEFDYGQDILNKRREQASFDFLCANINAEKAVLNQPKDLKVFTTSNGLKIAVISVLQIGENGLPDSHPKYFNNIKFKEPKSIVKSYKKKMKQYDMKIALTHLGIRVDRELAQENQWLDLVIGGHSHTILEKQEEYKHVTITQAGANVKYLGVNTITFIDEKILSIENHLIPLKFQKRDSLIQAKVKAFSNNPELQKQIANITYKIESREEIGQLMANAYKEGLNADIAFQNIAGVRSHFILEGPMKLIDVMYLDPFNNEIMLFELTKKEILSFLNYSFSIRHRPNQLISGLKAEFIINKKGELSNLILKYENGKELDDSKLYKDAINSYMASSYKFKGKAKAQYTGLSSNDLLVLFFEKYFPIGLN